ncbi:MAG: butyrate kinase [Symbiobacteriaceae bacterium]|jgi:butyrate kinase|nr:butyrate kinase [Symbiobacteriaceae bacterium]
MTTPTRHLILAINPGATSTKIGLYEGDAWRLRQVIPHDAADLSHFDGIIAQYPYRLELVRRTLNEAGVSPEDLTAVVARGGLLRPSPGGTYRINEEMLKDLEACTYGIHVSNLAPIIAYNIANPLGIPCFIVDPVTVDEFWPLSRLSGMPGLDRRSQTHALNSKAVARRVSNELGRPYHDLNLITVHLGTGISVAAHCHGRMVDATSGNQEGAFSPDRPGGLPAWGLLRLAWSEKYTREQLTTLMTREGGMSAYLGTKDVRVVEQRIAAGDAEAKLVLDSMCYQVAKEVGSMAAALAGSVDRIIITGGIAYSEYVVARIRERVEFLAPITVAPGEEELESLVEGALRVLNGQEQAREYPAQEVQSHVVV